MHKNSENFEVHVQLEKFLRTPLDGRLSFIGTVFKKCLYMQHETVWVLLRLWDFYTLQIKLLFIYLSFSPKRPEFYLCFIAL